MNKKAFTLIELLVVVLIIGILAAIALPQYQKAVEKSRWTEAVVYVNALSDAWDRHYLATNQYTTNMNDLDITVTPSKYFAAPVFDTGGGYPHIQSYRLGDTTRWVTRYSSTKMTYCTSLKSNDASNKFCADLTGKPGQSCPPPDSGGYNCYQIR